MHPTLPVNRILIAVDFSETARHAFYAGLSIAAKYAAETWILHVAEPIRSVDYGKRRYVETKETIERVEEGIHRRVDELWDEGGLEAVDRRKVHILVRGGRAATEIVESAAAKQVDLIVVGQTGGGTTERVTREAHCSVLAVRPAQRT